MSPEARGFFRGFAGVWTPVEFASALGRRPRRAQLAGEPLVLFREGSGKPAALLDRCPHRGAPLSRGRVNPDGHIECAYHGWCFGADGRRTRAPLNRLPGAEALPVRVLSLPVREAAGLVWVYTGAARGAPGPPPPEPWIPVRHPVRARSQRIFRAHWTRILENLLDSAHLPFVHRRTLYRMRAAVFPSRVALEDCVLHLKSEETPTGLEGRARVTGPGQLDRVNEAWFEWDRPNHIAFHNTWPALRAPHPFVLHMWIVPRGGRSTRIFSVLCTDAARLSAWPQLVMSMHRYSFGVEDRGTIEAQEPAEIPPPAQEMHMPTDAIPLAFRSYYSRELRGSSLELPGAQPAAEQAQAYLGPAAAGASGSPR